MGGITHMVRPFALRQVVLFALAVIIAFAMVLVTTQSAYAAVEPVVSGTVTDENSTPLQGVQVECHTANGDVNGTGTSGADGTYTCSMETSGLTVGTSTVVVEVREAPEGYRTPSGNNQTWQGVLITNINFALIPASKTITVTVYNQFGDLVENAQVTAQPIDRAPGNDVSQVQENGNPVTLDVSGGKWGVINQPGLSELDPNRYPWVTTDPMKLVEFADDNSEESAELEFTVFSGGTMVSVTMLDKDGVKLTQNEFNADVQFNCVTERGTITTQRKIDPTTGAARLFLLPGVCTVNAYHQQLQDQSYDPEEVTFVLEQSATEVNWGEVRAVQNTGTLSGTITIANEDEPTNFAVVATNLFTGQRYTTNAQQQNNGDFSIAGLALGEYSVTIENDGYLATQTASAKITQEENTVEDLAIEVHKLDQEISGSVVDGSGDELVAFPGTVVATNGDYQFSAPVGPDGTYSLKIFTEGLPNDTMELQLVGQPGAEAFAIGDTSVNVQPNGKTQATIATSPDEATITGTVTDFAGTELGSGALGKGAEVMALNLDNGSVEKADVQSDGSYSLEVGPGNWTVIPEVPDADVDIFASSVSNETISVAVGEEKTVDVPVQEGAGTVSGVITNPDGDPVGEAPVLLTNLPALQAEAEAAGEEVDPRMIVSEVVTTNPEGQFTATLPEGEFTATFGSNPNVTEYVEPEVKTVTVTANDDVTANGQFQEASSSVTGDIGNGFVSGSVTAFSADGGTETVDVEADGSFSINLDPGEWEFIAAGVKEGAVYVDEFNATVGSSEKEVAPNMVDTGVEFPAAVTVSGEADEPIVVTNTDGASLSLPAYSAALSGEVNVTLQPVIEFNNSGDVTQVGLAYEAIVLDEDGIGVKNLNRDATITLPLDEAFAGGANENELTAAYHSNELESFLYDGLTADTDGDKMVIQTSHLSKFAVTTTGELSSTPSKPLGLKVKNIKKTSARLSWKAPSSGVVSKYNVQLRACKNDTKKMCSKAKHYVKKGQWNKYNKVKKQASKARKVKSVKNLEPGMFYQFRVRAKNGADAGAWSSWVRFKTKAL